MMYCVRKSRIHGKGLFSARRIPRGFVLGICQDTETDEDGMYTLWVDEQGYRVECDFRYVNHSDQPNVAYCDDFTLVALETIPRGVELFHDY